MGTKTDRIAEWVLRTNARLPLPVLHGIANLIGSLLAIIPGKRVATCHTNIKACFPEFSAFQQRRLARKSFRQIAKGLMEVGKLWLRPAEQNLRLIKSVHGEEYVTELMGVGNKAIASLLRIANKHQQNRQHIIDQTQKLELDYLRIM